MRHLVVADVHANLAALDAVLDAARWDEILFLGDAIDAGPQPAETVERLLDLPGTFLAGNHDREILDVDPDAPADGPHEAWRRWTRRQLSDEHLSFLWNLEDGGRFESGGSAFRLHHGDFDLDVDGLGSRLWPDADPGPFTALANRYPEPALLHAHSHVQFEVERDGTTFANPGSVGAQRLGEPLACFAILENGDLSYRATPYDVEQTCAAMDELPIDPAFVEEWKHAYRTGTLPDRYGIRDFGPLREEDAFL